ncbi:hypothetical protein PHIM7_192 [Sinorhizobium phage phiM7]|uniref:Uncharacterized protein n=3 Tax=Emdodecavirus TaxID=1980937 RepID=S5MVG8_9CAUD|nr:transcriptional regulator [Sinorhizobium phage phiM12]YP_009212444.1 transcriptional regulator [Sinorhizobium phage phiN3]YP_009601317.1 transcriptional regulator [Sinorhizobium phage phiM7]AKF13097.1 hypothetical protein PHIM19_192 [Sinorhizobium phage phiM19]AGR47897.2 hypothetical protein SmphiM12_265 [Sinorhizobium phage phiM12]AKF12737.1 hypothetical protein PHIM7_192 [Sinorhizobium phage phiM7]AKF13467.1 hypothetical protein PHIN3_204 [Sinorhizobium phage phiN3]
MPTYNFKHRESDAEIETFMSFAERDQFLAEHPDWYQIITTAPSIGDPVHLGVRRTPESFNDALKYISDRNDNRKNKSQIHHR